MWEHGGCFSSVQLDTFTQCGHLEHVKCGEREKTLKPFQQMQQEGVQPDPVTFVGVLNACASVAALKKAGVLMSRSFKVVLNQIVLWGVAWSTCMQNVGA